MIEVRRQLEELIIQYSPLLYSMIRKHITTDYHDGWDAYQDICLHLWQYIPVMFDPYRGTHLFVYFRASVVTAVMSYRKRKRYRRLEPPIYREHFTDRLMGIIRSRDYLFIDYLAEHAVTPIQKQILNLCLKGHTPTEIMHLLHISRSSVYNYLNYFKKLVKEYKNVHI